MKKTLRNCAILLAALLLPSAYADVPRQLKWEDLVPRLSAAEDPFARLTRDQLLALADIADVRDRKARGDKTLSEVAIQDEEALTRKLQKAGIDVDGLLARRQEVAASRRAQTSAVNKSLEGQSVRLPGYLLPLEFSGKRVTEFLLVPWVGACIHTPPPPPNQIVHVKADKPFEMAGMFVPVWVTGTMSTAATKKSVFILDGSADIDVGYAIRADRVEPYRE